MRLAALLEAPSAFGSRYVDQCDDGPEQWQARLAGRNWFVATVDDAPAGLAACAPGDEAPGRWDVTSVWVDPARRGLGLAAQLLAAVRERAIAGGATELALWVTDGNAPATRLYASLGFVSTGNTQPLPSNPELAESELVLVLPVQPAARNCS